MSVWPISFDNIKSQVQHGERHAKYITFSEDEARKAFHNNILTYFPSYRYEQPGYLNDVFRMKLSYKYVSEFTGYFLNPIEITSDLPQIANWMMDIVLDNQLYGNNELLSILQKLISEILAVKHNKSVRIGIGQRNAGGARIQIVNSHTGEQIYPTIFNLSAGEASLLCIFGELIRQADRLGKKLEDIEGIVLVDEIDKHLHIRLQKEVIPALTVFFPKIQFIFSTHSPFVNIGLIDAFGDGCSVLDLDNNGIKCNVESNQVFQEAYDVMIKENNRYLILCNELSERLKNTAKTMVYLEGRTDEKYFKKAFEVFGYVNIDIDFQWIGYIDKTGNEAFTGSGGLNHGIQFLKGRKLSKLHFFLYDCDTNRQEYDEDNIVIFTMPKYNEHKIMNKGIENALELDEIELNHFYDEYKKPGDYGTEVIKKEFNKMKLCDYICGLDKDSQKHIFINLKPIIDKIIARAAINI